MICTTCNLHYPEHLNFCRRCGNTLTESMDKPAVESPCCTRCGARFISGENFCQQCGYKLSQRSQETVVGGCYGCGTPWRSGWLYCRKCGLDRDQALMGPVSASADGVSKVEPPGEPDDAGEIEVEKVPCPVCGVTIKPYSRFCEACGGSISPYSRPISAPIADVESLLTRHEATEAEEKPVDQRSEVTSATPGDNDISAESEVVVEPAPPAVRPFELQVVPVSDPGRRGVSTKGRKPESERDRTSAGNRRAGSAARAEKGGSGQVRMRREEKTKEPGNAAWQAFGIVSVVLIILGLLASWWVLRAEPAKRTEGEIVAPVETTTLPAVEKKAVPTPPEGMVFVAGGMLRMGRENGDEMERPIREVEVAPFFMDVTEVTNEMYLRYVRATGAAAPAHWPAQGDNRLYPDGEARFPVVNVSWEEAKAFAEWSGKRLPSEVEWEMAARGTEGRLYPWGDSWKDGRSNVGSTRTGRLMRVGSFPTGASPFGILDMCGNAWEWTADKPMRYGETSVLIAEGRVIRGGAYDVDASRATTTYRGIVPANKGYDKTGFRCVRDIQ